MSIVAVLRAADSLKAVPLQSRAHIGVCGCGLREVAFGPGGVEDDLGRGVGIFLGIELAVDRGKSAEA
jgi:hypothetical protein